MAQASFGVAPEAFWRLSLAEWRALTASAGAPILQRDELAALCARYPDQETIDEQSRD